MFNCEEKNHFLCPLHGLITLITIGFLIQNCAKNIKQKQKVYTEIWTE